MSVMCVVHFNGFDLKSPVGFLVANLLHFFHKFLSRILWILAFPHRSRERSGEVMARVQSVGGDGCRSRVRWLEGYVAEHAW